LSLIAETQVMAFCLVSTGTKTRLLVSMSVENWFPHVTSPL